ncbi:hypothetical protein JOJ86_007416 [Rhodococcus percolatus]|uniref:DUF4913 domain-containing protein n=1 Tax=Rhodococcus opacus TaxID=37919 RepID=UPI0015FC3932|nr:DUF4913 domain-containing protein [Rhodococcus opacus]MBA8965094.1 hypothetical protein [Rhodococcus opacus]MBP2209623.1 hypothetical protein [Rhodococcus opacus]
MTADGPNPVDVAELLDRIADLEKRLAATGDRQDMFAQALDAFEDAVHTAAAAEVPSAAADDTEETKPDRPPEKIDMPALYDWVHTHVGQWAQRKIPRSATGTSGVRWCPWWFEHPEAISRFEALRRAWTAYVEANDPTAMAVYFRDFYDRTIDALTSETGPFHACSPAGHRETEFVPIAPHPGKSEHDPGR